MKNYSHTVLQFLASIATCFGLTNQRQAVFYKHLGNISTLQYAIHTASVRMCFTQYIYLKYNLARHICTSLRLLASAGQPGHHQAHMLSRTLWKKWQRTVMCLRGVEISLLLQKRQTDISWNVACDLQVTVHRNKFL